MRLYHLGEDGIATTLCYGTIADALARAQAETDAVRDDLYLQTSNDVVAYRDFIGG